jgi:aminoglycoside phosphotransferase (APT) family kinase protein
MNQPIGETHSPEAFLQLLRREGLVTSPQARLTPLTGGVSSEIYRVEDGDKVMVVKRALGKLRVAADWRADPSRNLYEQAYLRYVGDLCPEAVPQVLFSRPETGFFGMEFLEGFRNWKTDLLSGVFSPTNARHAGRLLGNIHRASWNDPKVAREFDAMHLFTELRVNPYLRATADKHPPLAGIILAEADRLENSRQCLIHGDYSPKNMLHRNGRLVILDCEVACHGDAAFDLAFLLNHFLLKGLFHAPLHTTLPTLFEAAWTTYAEALGPKASPVLETAARLLPMLLLARVDGKSPVEYLSAKKQETVRAFATSRIRKGPETLETLGADWFHHL